MKNKSIVALAKEESIQESVSKVFDLLGGVTNMIEAGSTVVLKPNAGHAAPPELAVCTNPEVVRAVIREVKKASPKRIIVAEAAAIGCDTMECFAVSGIKDVAEDEAVELIDIKSDKDLINIPVRGFRSNTSHVKLPRFLLEAEHIINLPILKAHASMVFSCALKNIKGVVQDAVHLQMHQQNLTMAMMDVWYAVRADINIVDAIYAAGGYSPHTPVPLEIGCILGSYDPVAVDRIACDLVGIDTNYVDYFKVAESIGMGTTDPDDIQVVGEKVEDCRNNLWVPYLGDISSRWPEYDIRCQGACSSCQALLTLNMETLKAEGAYEANTDKMIVARSKNTIPKDVEPSKLVLHGNCTRRHLRDHPGALFIEGCPPGDPLLYITVSEGDPKLPPPVVRAKMESDQPVWRKYVDQKAAEFYQAQPKA